MRNEDREKFDEENYDKNDEYEYEYNEDEDFSEYEQYEEFDESNYEHDESISSVENEDDDKEFHQELKIEEDDDEEEPESGRIMLSEKEIDEALEQDETSDIQIKKVIYYCPEYDDVRNNKVKVWMFYDERIKKTLKVMSYWKNYDKNDLYQQGYIFFDDLCDIYIPYYGGKFYPFDRYVFKNLIIKLRAYIQNYYLKGKREQPAEISERNLVGKISNDIDEADDNLFAEHIYSMIDERQRDILYYTYSGYKQQEVGDRLDISQSRVSVIKKKTIKFLQEELDEEDFKRS